MPHAWMSKKYNDQGVVQCLACQHYCKIKPGRVGICGVRQNINGQLDLLVYGKVIAKAVDPIEKKPLYHFYPGSQAYSLGTIGCNFRCTFCQNWEISYYPQQYPGRIIGQDVSPEEVVEYCIANSIQSVAYTYNEPSIFFEYTYDVAKLARAKGIKNVYVSNGYISKEALKRIEPYLDAINIDLKSFNNDFYIMECSAKLRPVLDTIKRVAKTKIWLEITTLVIPGKNDSDDELKSIAEFVASISKDVPWHLSAFYPAYKMTDVQSTSLELLEKAYKIGKRAGLNYVYIGNVPYTEKQNTYCPGCGQAVINRSYYNVERLYTKEGKCDKCGKEIKIII